MSQTFPHPGNRLRPLVLLLMSTLLSLSAFPQGAGQPDDSYAPLTVEELQGVVGPFALYPDELVRYILPASTYPQDVLSAEAILKRTANQPQESDPQVTALQPSVQALLPFPDVIHQFAEYPDWLGELGNAVAYQQADVMDAIQLFRKRAYDAGNLKSTEQEQVIVEQSVIRIVQADPQVIYVPVYEPTTVVVQQTDPVITYGVGIPLGYWAWGGHPWGYWGGCKWNQKTTININGNPYRRPAAYHPAIPGYGVAGRPPYPAAGRPGYGVGGATPGGFPATRPATGLRDAPSAGRPRSGNTLGADAARPSSLGAFGGSGLGSGAWNSSQRGANSLGVGGAGFGGFGAGRAGFGGFGRRR